MSVKLVFREFYGSYESFPVTLEGMNLPRSLFIISDGRWGCIYAAFGGYYRAVKFLSDDAFVLQFR